MSVPVLLESGYALPVSPGANSDGSIAICVETEALRADQSSRLW